MKYEIQFSGHENIRSLHQKTIEITKESSLTTRGDCIIGVNATNGCEEIPLRLKEKLRNSNSRVRISLRVDNYEFIVTGMGHPDLVLTHKTDIVIRKSDFICPRTLAINCNKASNEIPRELIKILQNPKTRGILTIEAH